MLGSFIGSEETERRYYKQLDADFKRIVHNTDILSNVIGELVSELNAKDIEFIKGCVSPDDLPRKAGLETEMHNDRGEYVIMDNLFSITIPGEKEIGIMLNIEAQGDSEPGYPILNRALYYASGIVFNQKGTVFRESHYENMRKTYSIWFILQPKHGDENTILRYPLMKIPGLKKKKSNSEDCDMLEIMIVNLGGPVTSSNKTFRKLNDIFLSKLDGEKYRNHLKKSYNIQIDDNTLESLERMKMSLGEEIVNYQRRVGYNAGHSEGYAEGHSEGYTAGRSEGYSEGRSDGYSEGYGKGYGEGFNKYCDGMATMIINLVTELNTTADKAFELSGASQDDKNEIMKIVNEKLGQN